MSESEPPTPPAPVDFRLVPVAVAAWVGMWIATAGDTGWLTLGAVAGGACALIQNRRFLSTPIWDAAPPPLAVLRRTAWSGPRAPRCGGRWRRW